LADRYGAGARPTQRLGIERGGLHQTDAPIIRQFGGALVDDEVIYRINTRFWPKLGGNQESFRGPINMAHDMTRFCHGKSNVAISNLSQNLTRMQGL